jgi:hypothetical protein
VNTGAGDPYEFQEVIVGGNLITSYTLAFAKGTSIARAESEILSQFPTDTKVSGTGVITGSRAGSCRWLNVTSKSLGKLFGGGKKLSVALQKLLGSPNNASVEFATADSSDNWTYDASDINEADVGVGWVTPSSGC